MSRLLKFGVLKRLSFLHSAIYFALLISAFALHADGATMVLGWAHGIGWICMSLLVLAALQRRVIPFWLAVTVAVIGGVGPFAGSIGFVVAERRGEDRPRAGATPVNGASHARTAER